MVGGEGADVLYGGTGAAVRGGGVETRLYDGVDYTITDGSHDGATDRFIFRELEGNDTIWGFEGGQGGDIIDLSAISGITGWGELFPYQDGADTVIGLHADPIAEEWHRSEEHTSELQSLMRISYAVFC